MSESDPDYPREKAPARLSRTPSWIMLGFVLGGVFVWLLPTPKRSVPPEEKAPPKTVVVRHERPSMTEIEAVFAEWGKYAVWDNDVTQVALWDRDKKAYAIFYEVLRSGETYYFRSISRLTRPVLDHGVQLNSPLLFTETQEMRSEWLEHGRFERPPMPEAPQKMDLPDERAGGEAKTTPAAKPPGGGGDR